jgi:isoleucyl-tRNA synthetase
VDGFTHREEDVPLEERQEIDRWILSELNSLTKLYRLSMDAYDVTRAARAVSDFTVDYLSNWYVRRNRRRFWKSEKGKDKTAAYQTLFECLFVIAKMMAPFAPFVADELFRCLNGAAKRDSATSVHLSTIPKVNESAVDELLERRMELAMEVVGLVRAMRMKSNLKVRQPLKRIIIPLQNDRMRQDIERMREIILEEVNVKSIEFVADEAGIVKKKAKANFKSLGKKLGKEMQSVAGAIRELSSSQISLLQKNGKLALEVGGKSFELVPEDIEVSTEEVEGLLVESDGSLTVALDPSLTETLIAEGLAREFVNRIQNLRKESGFEVTDRIKIYHHSSERLSAAVGSLAEYVKQETLAVDILPINLSNGSRRSTKVEINGEETEVAVERI